MLGRNNGGAATSQQMCVFATSEDRSSKTGRLIMGCGHQLQQLSQ